MRHTPRLGWTLCSALLMLAVYPLAQTPTPQPRFKGGTDLVQVDVSVLDGKRRPVRGLTAADFTLLEDGQPREIQAFTEVYLPDRVAGEAAPWMREVTSDVASNQASEQEGRLVIIMFDRTIPVGEPTLTAKRTAAAIVNQLGPGDLAAVVSTGAAETHNFTSDRSRLLRTITQSDVSSGSSSESQEIEERVFVLVPEMRNPLNDGRCLCGVCVPDTITRVANAVQSTARRRKVLFFIGSNLTVQASTKIMDGETVGCEIPLKDARNAMFNALDRANLTVHSLDPSGLHNIGPTSRASTTLTASAVRDRGMRDTNEHLQQQGALTILPDRTGGRTVVNTNAPELQVDGIFRESDSYYLIGFRPTAPDAKGTTHAIAVKANRPGLHVHARTSYSSAPLTETTASASTPDALAAPLRAALTGLLPTSDIPIDLTAATFAVPGARRSAVTLSVGVSAFISSMSATAHTKQGAPLEVVASAFDRGGRPRGLAKHTIEASWPGGANTQERRFDVLSRLDLPPGDYELRIAVSGTEPSRTASVFSYVTVPAFDSAPLSLSSIVLGATAGTLTAPKDFLAGVLPLVPTTRREFSNKDRLVGFLRIYQGTNRQDPLLPVQLRSSLIDAQGKIVSGQSDALQPTQFDRTRTADHYLILPLTNLTPGDYLLTLQADMGKRTAGRAVRFVIR
jgi:VWFA-related protein